MHYHSCVFKPAYLATINIVPRPDQITWHHYIQGLWSLELKRPMLRCLLEYTVNHNPKNFKKVEKIVDWTLWLITPVLNTQGLNIPGLNIPELTIPGLKCLCNHSEVKKIIDLQWWCWSSLPSWSIFCTWKNWGACHC